MRTVMHLHDSSRGRARAGTLALAALVCAAAIVARAPARRVLYGVGDEDWWSNEAHDSYSEQISRGGRQSWEGHADSFWRGDVETEGGSGGVPSASSAFTPQQEIEPRVGGVDITDVGEGTERVRLGLEGEWSGIVSATRPGVDQEGAGAGWLRPSQQEPAVASPAPAWQAKSVSPVAARENTLGRDGDGFGVRGGFGEPYDIMNPPLGGVSAYPSTSSYAYERTPDRWVSEDGSFPGGLEEGTFPGVNPNDPDGTSWMIGMHRDGENTVGRWANAHRRGGLARRQQLALVSAGVTSAGVLRARGWPAVHESKLTVLRSGRGRLERGREEQLSLTDCHTTDTCYDESTGADITDLGESNRDHDVEGEWGNRPQATSWVVGEHRQLHWSDSQVPTERVQGSGWFVGGGGG